MSTGSLNMNLGGLDLTYDLGPSTSTVFKQGLSFLNSRFNADQAFTGGAIMGANNMVSGLVAPLIQGANDQLVQNATEIPSLYSTMESNNYNIGMTAINTEAQVANASIASAQSSAHSASEAGGGCYVTSAVCETLGLPDDCHTLRTLRTFRDTYLLRSNVGRAFVAEYYATAPRLCAKIHARSDAARYFGRLYDSFILPALLEIERGAKDRAFKIYRRMIYTIIEENP